LAVPKETHTTALRALLTARRSAVKAHTAATNQIHALLVTAPAEVRERYRRHSITALVTALARCRPATHSDPTTVAVLTAGKALAQRMEFLERQKRNFAAQLDVLVQQTNPALRAAYGIGPDTAAQLLVTAGANPERLRSEASLAALCGVAPVPASSGKITRHRLSRGGDRAANNALYRIALVRMSAHPQTRDYVQRQAANGRTKKEILRLLKRAIIREIFRLLTRPTPIDDYRDLRPARQVKNLTLATVATHFGVPLITISRLERGHQRNDTLANNYRQWLTAA
jgi:transposase